MTTRPEAAQRVAAELRDDLLSGRLQPGHRVKEEDLVERFRTGRYTIRSALRSLESAGLLEHRRNRGAVVPTLDRSRVETVMDLREVLEIGALGLALGRGADFGPVVEATRALHALAEDASWTDVIDVHQNIHHVLVEVSGNDRLLKAYAQCEEELRYVVSMVRPDYTAQRLAMLHDELLAGLELGGDRALAALRRDLHTGRDAVLEATAEE